MQYRYLGASPLRVSPLCLGTMMFGAATPDDEAQRIIDAARDAGVNFIDTADVYNGGASETVVGQGVARQRDHWVLATKFVNAPSPGPNRGGISRKWIIEAVEGSLKRLGSDYIDILYFHRAVTDRGLDEALLTLGDLIRAGKLRYYGVSNFRGWRIAAIVAAADRLGVPRPVVSQPLYNIVTRNAEVEEIPAAQAHGLGVVPYSPLARGVLTGKYRADGGPDPDSRVGRGDPRIRETEYRPESLAVAERLAAHAAERGIALPQFAAAWVLRNAQIASLIAGPRTFAQWQGYLAALDARLTDADEAFVDSLVAPGHASTQFYTDPRYPVEGRSVAGGSAA